MYSSAAAAVMKERCSDEEMIGSYVLHPDRKSSSINKAVVGDESVVSPPDDAVIKKRRKGDEV